MNLEHILEDIAVLTFSSFLNLDLDFLNLDFLNFNIAPRLSLIGLAVSYFEKYGARYI